MEKTGSFACVGGSWADVLPMCLGPTYPGSPGGHPGKRRGDWLSRGEMVLEDSWLPLPKTNSSPLKIGLNAPKVRNRSYSNHPFAGAMLDVW